MTTLNQKTLDNIKIILNDLRDYLDINNKNNKNNKNKNYNFIFLKSKLEHILKSNEELKDFIEGNIKETRKIKRINIRRIYGGNYARIN